MRRNFIMKIIIRGIWVLVISFFLALAISDNAYATENQNKNTEVSLNKESLALTVDDYYVLKLNGVKAKKVETVDGNFTYIDYVMPEITYKSTNNKIATVNSVGVVRAKKIGTCNINVTCEGKTYVCKVKVKIALSSKKLNMIKKQEHKLKLMGVKTSKVKFSSTNKKVATVNSRGKIVAKKNGSCKIKAKYKNKTYVCKITVKKEKKPKYGDWTLDEGRVDASKYEWMWQSVIYKWDEDNEEWLSYRKGSRRFNDEEFCNKHIETYFNVADKVLKPKYSGEYDGETTEEVFIYIYLNEGKK